MYNAWYTTLSFICFSENDFASGTIVLESSNNFLSAQFEIAQDDKEEPQEVFVLIFENKDGPVMETVVIDSNEVNKTICSLGVILESDSTGKMICMYTNLFNELI